MRIFVAILVTAAVSSAITIALLNHPAASLPSTPSQSAGQDLRSSNGTSRTGRHLLSMRSKTAAASARSAQLLTQQAQGPRAAEIIRQLAEVQPQTGNLYGSQRKLIHGFESLAALGVTALPDITEYLSSNQNVDYAKLGIVNDTLNWWSTRRPIATPMAADSHATKPSAEELAKKAADNQLRQQDAYRLGPTEYFCPPTLRLGLIETLGRLDDSAAEQTLADELRYSESSSELVVIDHLLERLAPGKYRQDTLATAREGLSQPRVQAANNSAEWQKELGQRTRFYALLIKHGDTTFVNEAQSQLLLANGQIDSEALNYLQRTLKEQSVPYLIQTARNLDDSKNNYATYSLNSAIMRYVGENSAADQYFLDAMQSSQNTQSKISTLYNIQQLSPATQEGAQRRLQLLDRVESSATDESLKQHFKSVRRGLESLRDAKNLTPNSLYQWNGLGGVQSFSIGDSSGPATIIVRPAK